MDYKKKFKSRKIRLAILKFFSFVPDKWMITIQYRIKTGNKLNMKNPQRFTEKLQWYKLNYRIPLMRQCVNKYLVREYVNECGLSNILIPLIGIYEKPENIDFDALPMQFVIKDTLGGGGNAVILCKDKSRFNQERINNQMKSWVNISTSYKNGGREWVYGGMKHQIIIEEMLPSKEEEGGLIDYKFFCFYGVPVFVYIVADRKVGRKAGVGIFTSDFYKLDVVRVDENPLERNMSKPVNYEDLLETAQILSKPFPEVRIDLYSVNGRVYFGEMTFFDGSGYMTFEPDTFDYKMGKFFVLPQKMKA